VSACSHCTPHCDQLLLCRLRLLPDLCPLPLLLCFSCRVATVADTSSGITISVGGVVASAMAAPTVFAEPDVDCAGAWLPCGGDCVRRYEITTVSSGQGTQCPYEWSAEEACRPGEGSCAADIDPAEEGTGKSIRTDAQHKCVPTSRLTMLWLRVMSCGDHSCSRDACSRR
jgi:hypothetical protein